jgi:uncharacterized protein YdhG (YjbR/CyaY superfamily)
MTERGSAAAGPLSAYLASLPDPVRGVLTAIVEQAGDLVEAEEGVSYAMPALLYRGRALLAVRETSKHLALYPYSGRTVAAVSTLLDTGGFGYSSGAIRFSSEHPLPPDLVERIVHVRRDEIDTALDK